MKSVYSPSENVIYPYQLYADYERAGSWPADGIEISDDDAFNFNSVNQPAGKVLGYADGSLAWFDAPVPTHDQLVIEADKTRQQLIADANQITADWRTELALEIIDDDDKAKLTAWMKYIKAVKSVDTSTAPDISWPIQPEK